MNPYRFTPWRLKFSTRDGWEVWTKRDKTLGSRNNYAVATGIQDEQEGRVLAAAPELAKALRELLSAWHGRTATVDTCDLASWELKAEKQAQAILDKLDDFAPTEAHGKKG